MDELEELIPKKRRRRKRNRVRSEQRKYKQQDEPTSCLHRNLASAATQASAGHLDPLGKEMLQTLGALDPGKRIVPTTQVTKSEGAEQENWKLAAEVEMQSNFINMHSLHESTDEERASHGRPLPML